MKSSSALFVSLALLCAACGPKPTGEMKGRGVLVIAIDALRADHMSGLGYDRKTTPVLDNLAAQGVTFSSAWSAAPDVVPAHAAILTGCDPRLAQRPSVKVTGRESELASWYVPDALPRLSQQFLAQGFETAAFVDHAALSPVHGFAKGFQQLVGLSGSDAAPQAQIGFEGVAARFMNWLNAHPPARSWFAYVHVGDLERLWQRVETDPHWDTFFEPRPELAHVPAVADGDHVFFAVPRGRWSGGTLSLGEYEARYDGALRQMDTKLARLFDNMRRRGWLENTTIVIVGTHGVSLGESGLYADSGTLSDTDLHVPLIIRPPLKFDAPRGHRSTILVSTLDIAPTLLEMHAIPVSRAMQGVSLLDAVRGLSTPVRGIAFASGGLQRGRLALDTRYCFEESWPGEALDPQVVRSWYGDTLDHRGEARLFLHDRESASGPGHVEGSSPDASATDRLSRACSDWFAAVDDARALLHRPTAASAVESGALIDDLVKRGLLGPPIK
ncbi:MAG: sulfatase [Planctomycetes bacterium]|nr:sulfatase [Planctomycetota bacterium]